MQPLHVAGDSPRWRTLSAFFRQFDVAIETPGVRKVRDLRHFLTHSRGELRTEELRREFQATHTDVMPPWTVELSQVRVVEAMDKLAAAIRQIDPVVYQYSWGRASFPNLST
jgi:hypothetical protein